MNNTVKALVAVVIVAVIAGGAYMLMKKDDTANNGTAATSTSESTGEQSSPDSSSETPAPASEVVSVRYAANGFSPNDVTVPAGGQLKITNDSDSTIEPASDPHPVHTNNPELNFGDIEPGKSKTVTLTTKGSWGMHNHYNPNQHATVTVQ